jgi:transcriptional regulator of aromatic amino acid metabolism
MKKVNKKDLKIEELNVYINSIMSKFTKSKTDNKIINNYETKFIEALFEQFDSEKDLNDRYYYKVLLKIVNEKNIDKIRFNLDSNTRYKFDK